MKTILDRFIFVLLFELVSEKFSLTVYGSSTTLHDPVTCHDIVSDLMDEAATFAEDKAHGWCTESMAVQRRNIYDGALLRARLPIL